MSRPRLRMPTGILTGHCTLTKHMHYVDLINYPHCRSCLGLAEIPAHLLANCLVWDAGRWSYFGAVTVDEHRLWKQRTSNTRTSRALLSSRKIESRGLKWYDSILGILTVRDLPVQRMEKKTSFHLRQYGTLRSYFIQNGVSISIALRTCWCKGRVCNFLQ